MAELLANPAVWASFLSLTILEIVLGVDNVLFISIAASKLPEHQRRQARLIGLGLGMLMRILLLFAISWIASLTRPIFSVLDQTVSWRDIILIAGGLFLIWKSANEIFTELEDRHSQRRSRHTGFWSVIVQIIILDAVFSLDSVITAVGIAEHIEVMVAAIIIAVIVMMFFAEGLSSFVERHPSAKMLALAFLAMVGLALVSDGLHHHIDREYIYAAMLFACLVETLNLIRSSRREKAGHDDRPASRD